MSVGRVEIRTRCRSKACKLSHHAVLVKASPTENSEIGNCDEEFLESHHIAMDDHTYPTIVSTPAAKSKHPLHQVGLKAISPPLAVYTKSLCRGVQIRRTSDVGGETVR